MGKHSAMQVARGIAAAPGAKGLAVATVAGTLFGVGSTMAMAAPEAEAETAVPVVEDIVAATVDLSTGIDEAVSAEESGWTFTSAKAEIKPAPVVQAPSAGTQNSGNVASGSAVAEAAAAVPRDGELSSQIAAIARTGVGVPYVWGGTSTSGWDCSGFVGWVYKQVGISLPRTDSGIRSVGTPVSAADAQPGDILWWPGHVGIYLGGGSHVAAHRPGVGTTVSSIYGSPTYLRIG